MERLYIITTYDKQDFNSKYPDSYKVNRSWVTTETELLQWIDINTDTYYSVTEIKKA